MTQPYKLNYRSNLHPHHPLHWLNFWPDLQRIHHSSVIARQDLVFWLANLHANATKDNLPLGMSEVKCRLCDLRAWVRDYEPALLHFFSIKQRGFFIDDENHDVSTLIPKRLPRLESVQVKRVVRSLKYKLPPLPEEDTIISKVYLRSGLVLAPLLDQVRLCGRPELVPQVTWLLSQDSPEFNFHFKPSGKLKLRDTSVWPIAAIETWPSWLREELFGKGIDLDAAYIQFLMQNLKEVYKHDLRLIPVLYKDLERLLNDKEGLREELCTELLGLPYTDKNRSFIKQILMSIANGSKISAKLLETGSTYSQTVQVILQGTKSLQHVDFNKIGDRLQQIASQFSSARKVCALHLFKHVPNRDRIKKVFSEYFSWEREARYAIWEEVNRQGLMVHDGLDGVPEHELARLDEIMEKLTLKLTTKESKAT